MKVQNEDEFNLEYELYKRDLKDLFKRSLKLNGSQLIDEYNLLMERARDKGLFSDEYIDKAIYSFKELVTSPERTKINNLNKLKSFSKKARKKFENLV